MSAGATDRAPLSGHDVVALLAFVGVEMKAGKTKDEVTAITVPLKGFDQHGPLNRTVLGNAYDELAAPA